MDKYSKIKRFQYDHRIQFYMYAFMYADPEAITEEFYFTAKNKSLHTAKKTNPRTNNKKLAWI